MPQALIGDPTGLWSDLGPGFTIFDPRECFTLLASDNDLPPYTNISANGRVYFWCDIISCKSMIGTWMASQNQRKDGILKTKCAHKLGGKRDPLVISGKTFTDVNGAENCPVLPELGPTVLPCGQGKGMFATGDVLASWSIGFYYRRVWNMSVFNVTEGYIAQRRSEATVLLGKYPCTDQWGVQDEAAVKTVRLAGSNLSWEFLPDEPMMMGSATIGFYSVDMACAGKHKNVTIEVVKDAVEALPSFGGQLNVTAYVDPDCINCAIVDPGYKCKYEFETGYRVPMATQLLNLSTTGCKTRTYDGLSSCIRDHGRSLNYLVRKFEVAPSLLVVGPSSLTLLAQTVAFQELDVWIDFGAYCAGTPLPKKTVNVSDVGSTNLSFTCAYPGQQQTYTDTATRVVRARGPVLLPGVDALDGSAALRVPRDLVWFDKFVQFNAADWMKTSAVDVCSGVYNLDDTWQELVAHGHRNVYFDNGTTVTITWNLTLGYPAEAATSSAFVLSLKTPTNQDLIKISVNSSGMFQVQSKGATYYEQRNWTNLTFPNASSLNLNIVIFKNLTGQWTMRVRATNDTGTLVPEFLLPTRWAPGSMDGVPVMFSLGLRRAVQAGIVGFRVETTWQRELLCCNASVSQKALVKAGQDNTPEIYFPPVGQCVFINNSDPNLPVTFYTVPPDPPNVSTRQVGLTAVKYVCTHPPAFSGEVNSTFGTIVRDFPVTVHDALQIESANTVFKVRQFTKFVDPGATCRDRNGVFVTDDRLYSTPAELDTSTPSSTIITWTCCFDGRRPCLRNVSGFRNVEVLEPLKIYGASPTFLDTPSKYQEMRARCADGMDVSWAKVEYDYVAGDGSNQRINSITTFTSFNGGDLMKFLVTYSCNVTIPTNGTRTVYALQGGVQLSCYVNGKGEDSPRILLQGEPYPDPQVCCHVNNKSFSFVGASSGDISTTRAGSRVMVYHCDFGVRSLSCKREILVNEAPNVYLMGRPVTRTVWGQPYTDDGAICMDAEDGVVPIKVRDGVLHQLPFFRAGDVPSATNRIAGLPDGTVENLFDGTLGSCANLTDIPNEMKCFVDLQVEQNASVLLDLGMVRIVESVDISGYRISGGSKKNTSIIVDLLLGELAIPCGEQTLMLMGTKKVVCGSPTPARHIRVNVLSAKTILCEVAVYGEPAPDIPRAFELSVSGTRGTTSTPCDGGTGAPVYSCKLGIDRGQLGQRYECWPGSDAKEPPALSIYREAVSAGDWRKLLPFDRWVIKRGLVTLAQAAGGVNVPPDKPTLWKSPAENTEPWACSFQLTVPNCDRCSGWPLTLCKDPSMSCTPRVDNAIGYPFAYMETASTVDTSKVGTYYVTYQCIDGAGSAASITRTVKVNCEAPSSDATFGGNALACTTQGELGHNFSDWESCAEACAYAGEVVCEAYEYWDLANRTFGDREKGDCIFFTSCTGRMQFNEARTTMSQNSLGMVQVGYCVRKNTPPEILVTNETQILRFSSRASSLSTPCQCDDFEDVVPRSCLSDWDQVIRGAASIGMYEVTFTCIDSQGAQSSTKLDVGLSGQCGVISDGEGGHCGIEGYNSYEVGDLCEVACQVGREPTFAEALCELPPMEETGNLTLTPRWRTRGVGTVNDNTVLCSVLPCEEPRGIDNVYLMTDNVYGINKVAPCLNGRATGKIAGNGGLCIPRCSDGYVSSTRELVCNAGTLTPPTFTCMERSTGVVTLDGIPSTMDIRLNWTKVRVTPGCVPKGLRLQVRKGHTLEMDMMEYEWMNVSGRGCAWENLTYANGRTFDDVRLQGCVATHTVNETGGSEPLQGGQGYVFRMMEYCTEPVFDSVWKESALIYLQVIPVPEISFRVPVVDDRTYSSPDIVVALMNTKVVPNIGSNKSLLLTRRSSPGCPEWVFQVQAEQITLESTTDYGKAGLSNEAIMMFTPAQGFWQPSCSFTTTFEEGVLRTVLQPSKVNRLLSWNFTWVERGPLQQAMKVQKNMLVRSGGITADVDVQFVGRANFTCSAIATDNVSALMSLGWHNSAAPDWLTNATSSLSNTKQVGGAMMRPVYVPAPTLTAKRVIMLEPTYEAIRVSIAGLVPSTEYNFECGGSKTDRWWVSTECSGESCPVEKMFTPNDTSSELDYVNITRIALCPDVEMNEAGFPDYHRTYEGVLMSLPTQIFVDPMITGQLLQVEDWQRACNITLDPDNSSDKYAYMRLRMIAVPKSAYSTVHWINGPFIDIKYQKQKSHEIPLVITRPIQLKVCPHVAPAGLVDLPNEACKSYTTRVAAVFGTIGIIKVEIGDNAIVARRGVSEAMKLGTTVRIYIDINGGRFNVSSMGVVAGSIGFGFTQACTYEGENIIKFRLVAQGKHVPLFVTWMGSDFPTEYSFDVAPPTLNMSSAKQDKWSLSLVNVNELVVSFALHYGATPQLEEELRAMLTASSKLPAHVFRLSIRKANATYRGEELCSKGSMSDWGTISCNVQRAPLTGLRTFLEYRDFASTAADQFVVVDLLGLRDKIEFKPPMLSCLERSLFACAQTTLLLAEFTQDVEGGAVPTINVIGDNFPNLEEMVLKDTALPDYRLSMRTKDDSGEVPLCKSIRRVNAKMLSCELATCMDARRLNMHPRLKLEVGDFSTSPDEKFLMMPQPSITEVLPREVNDTGAVNITVRGYDFGLPIGDFETVEEACERIQNESQRLREERQKATGVSTDERTAARSIRIFGEPRVQVGDAPCRTSFHNDTVVECEISTPVRPPRSPPTRGQARGSLVTKKEVEVAINTGQLKNTFSLATVLSLCLDGQRRIHQDSTECELCPPGTYSKVGFDEFPLQCTRCPPSTYQDRPGSTSCKACPANTVASGLFAARREECVCLPGFYSPVWNENKTAGLPGYACKSCMTEDMITTPPRGILCGRDITIRTKCDEDLAQTCVSSPKGKYDYRMCKAFCPGGMNLPEAKAQFFLTGATAMIGTTGAKKQEYRPDIVKCEPKQACGSRNRCAIGYTGEACQECVFGYYRDRLSGNVCTRCDEKAASGAIGMAAAAVMFTLGAFVFSLLDLKLLSDPIFKCQAVAFVKRTIKTLMSLKGGSSGRAVSSSRGGGCFGLWRNFWGRYGFVAQRQTVRLSQYEVGAYLNYFRTGDLGMIIRVDESSVCHVAALKKGSPASLAGVQKDWELRLINGRHVRAHTELEVRLMLSKAHLPLTLTFMGVKREASGEEAKDDNEGFDPAQSAELGGKAYDTLRMATMILSILQSFKAIARLDLDWPPIFKFFAGLVANITLDLTYLAPECSIDSKYEQNWLMFLLIPYLVISAIIFSYSLMRMILCFTIDVDADLRQLQEWLLRNAFNRGALSVLLVFVSNHMELLWSPFTCLARDDGHSVMLNAQDIRCSHEDPRYVLIWAIAVAGWSILSGVYALLLWCMYKSYFWQVGARMRSRVPGYVAAVESAAAGMKGYEPAFVSRVMFNIVAPNIFPASENAGRYFQHATVAVSERYMDFNYREKHPGEDEFGNRLVRKQGGHEDLSKVLGHSSVDDKFFEDDSWDDDDWKSSTEEDYASLVGDGSSVGDGEDWGDYFAPRLGADCDDDDIKQIKNEYFAFEDYDEADFDDFDDWERDPDDFSESSFSSDDPDKWQYSRSAEKRLAAARSVYEKTRQSEYAMRQSQYDNGWGYEDDAYGDDYDRESDARWDGARSVRSYYVAEGKKKRNKDKKKGDEERSADEYDQDETGVVDGRDEQKPKKKKKDKGRSYEGYDDQEWDYDEGEPWDETGYRQNSEGVMSRTSDPKKKKKDKKEKKEKHRTSEDEGGPQDDYYEQFKEQANRENEASIGGSNGGSRETFDEMTPTPTEKKKKDKKRKKSPSGVSEFFPPADEDLADEAVHRWSSVETMGPVLTVEKSVKKETSGSRAASEASAIGSDDMAPETSTKKKQKLRLSVTSAAPSRSVPMTRDEWAALFDAVAKADQGRITKAEFSRQPDFKMSLYKVIDVNKVGYLSHDAWMRVFDDHSSRDDVASLVNYIVEAPRVSQQNSLEVERWARCCAPADLTEARNLKKSTTLDINAVQRAKVEKTSLGKTRSAATEGSPRLKLGDRMRSSRSDSSVVVKRKDGAWLDVLSLFGISDPLHDGRLTKQQWSSGFGTFDVDGTGQITKAEWRLQSRFKVALFNLIAKQDIEDDLIDSSEWDMAYESLRDEEGLVPLQAWIKPLSLDKKSSRSPASVSMTGTASSSPRRKKVRSEAQHRTAPPTDALEKEASTQSTAAESSLAKDAPPEAAEQAEEPKKRVGLCKNQDVTNPVPSRTILKVGTRNTARAKVKDKDSGMSKASRGRKRRKEALKQMFGLVDSNLRLRHKPGATLVTTTLVAKDTILSMDKFKDNGRIKWPDCLSGSFLSYGWVLLVNNFGRTFCLLATICLTSSMPPIAASGQATVFFLNFGLIMFVMPYSNRALSLQEALLLGCLALLVWGASFRDLLQNHKRAQDYPSTVDFVGQCIDIIVLFLVMVIFAGICVVARALLKGLFKVESETQALNRAYAYRAKSMMRARDFEKMNLNFDQAAKQHRDQEHVSLQTYFTQLALEMHSYQHSEFVPPEDAAKMKLIFKWMLKGASEAPENKKHHRHKVPRREPTTK